MLRYFSIAGVIPFVKPLPIESVEEALNGAVGDTANSDVQIWNGDESIATWTAVGVNRELISDQIYSSMFDNNDLTFWHGVIPATETNKVIVSFKSPIMFYKLVFTARPAVISNQERYQGVCLYLDNVQYVCTASNRVTIPSEKIEFNPTDLNLQVKKPLYSNPEVTTVELRFPVVSGDYIAAEIAELQIYYNLQGTKLLVQSLTQ